MAASNEPTATLNPDGAEVQEEQRSAALAGEPPGKPAPGSSANFAIALRDSIITALIAAAIFVPIVGMRTSPGITGLDIDFDLGAPHWVTTFVIIAIVFFGRLLLNLFVWRDNRPLFARKAAPAKAGVAKPARRIPGAGFIGPIVFLLVTVGLPIYVIAYYPQQSRYILDLGTLILTYVMLGWGLNIVVGLAGLLDLGYVAFYAVGAYSFALIAEHFGLSFWVCLPLAGLFAATWGVILGFPVLRLRGDYLAIVTLAFGEIIRLVLINWVPVTHGPDGINNIPRPSFFGLDFVRGEGGFANFFGLDYSPTQRIVFLYFVILLMALLTNFVTIRVRRLPIGRAWEALREDEIACRSLGINTTNTKLAAFAMGAMFGGFAGSFFATRQGFISPESFNFTESATILAIVVLGGLGSQFGVAVAATVMIGGIELLRNLGFLKAFFGQDFDPALYRMLIFGVVMVGIMVWRPRGVVQTRQPSVFRLQRKGISGDLVGEGQG